MQKLPIVKDSIPYLLTTLLVSVVLYIIYKPLSIIGIILLLFLAFFFRNPPRKITQDKNTILSPADGVVMSVTEISEPDFLGENAIKVSIFLSVFNVHVNRTPIAGTVKYTHYRPGKFLPAFKSHASDINERNTIGIEGNGIKLLVHQITGFVARRIVCHVKKGDSLNQGDIYGLIKFGSCTEVVVPTGVTIKVKPGEKVKGGITVIGVVNN